MKIRGLLAITLVLGACNSNRSQSLAPGQLSMHEMQMRAAEKRKKAADREAALLAETRSMTVEQEKWKLARLKAAPQDRDGYNQLMRYYENKQDFKGKAALIIWYIEHAPTGNVWAWNINPSWDRAGYLEGRRLWLKHLKQEGASAEIYERAAAFLQGGDKPLAEEVLLAGRKQYPEDKRWGRALGMHYAQVLLGSAEPLTENNVFRLASAMEAHGEYARSVRTKLAGSGDALVLAQTAQWLMAWNRTGEKSGRDFDPVVLARQYADHALALEPDNESARLIQSRVEHRTSDLRLLEFAKLPPGERAKLSGSEKMRGLLWELDRELWKENDDGAVAKARELLNLASSETKDNLCGEVIYAANIALGKIALRNGDKRTAVGRMFAAADSPVSSELILSGNFQSGMLDMNLMRDLVDWGERDAVAQFLERMAPKTKRGKEFLDWAGQIRKGINPDMLPVRSGCLKSPC